MKLSGCLLILTLITSSACAQNSSISQVLNYLYSIMGKKMLSGTHNREPNADPARWTNKIKETTGHYPALWSGDFLFQQDNINNRQLMIDEAVRQWNKGAVVNIMWHACNPALAEPCGWKGGVLSKLTDQQWLELTTDGSTLNKIWKSRVDEVCVYLQQLKDKNIEVLWRPLHEMNQGNFWWGGRSGPQGTIRLYHMLHDYMVKEKKLTNLVWVWDMQDFNTLAADLKVYEPAAGYWDILALDIYDQSGYTEEKYQAIVNASHGKPIAIGECSKLPGPGLLTLQAKWTFFMSWAELGFQENSVEQIKLLHADPKVVNLDKMPGWAN